MAPKMVPIFMVLSSFASLVLSPPTVKTLPVPSGGAESIAFDAAGNLYTGVNDGYILKYAGGKWSEFAYASPTRTKEQCDGTKDMALGRICGRTLGLGVHQDSQTLYIADTYHGLNAVGPQGGLATQLLSQVEGQHLIWPDGLDVDQKTGFVYLTEASTVYNFSQFMELLNTGDSSGRAIEYNPYTRKSRNLLTGLGVAAGIGVSKDSSYVLISEFLGNKIRKYWLKGPKKDTSELILEPTAPANIKLTQAGDFWARVTINGSTAGIRIDGNGNILEHLLFPEPYQGVTAEEVQAYNDVFYITSFQSSFIGIYDPLKASIQCD